MKSIEQLAKESYEQNLNADTGSYEGFFNYTDEKIYSAGFTEGVKHSEKWIPIIEFPEKQNGKYSEIVLVKDIDGDCFVCYYNYKLNRFVSDESGNTINNVTHWRHIHINNRK